MAMKILSIVESAYRATLEEQDDTILWMNTAMKGAGADITVLLRGNAVNYCVTAQNAAGLSFGGMEQSHPPAIADDVKRLMEKGATVYAVQDDIAERGLERSDLIDGIETLPRGKVAGLIASHDQIWHW